MRRSVHWRFNLREFACFFLGVLALWAAFYLLAREQMRTWVNLDLRSSISPTHLMLQFLLLWGIVIAGGLLLCRRVGIEPLALWPAARRTSFLQRAGMVMARGVLCGLALTIAFEVLTRVFFHEQIDEWNAAVTFRGWRAYLAAAIGAALGEELFFRLLLFPLAAWLLGLIWKKPDGLPAVGAMWFSMVVASLLFASTHLLVLQDLGGYTPGNITRAMLVFTPPGLILGLVFWKYGIETAMTAHASGLIGGWLFVSALAALRGN